MTSRHQHRQREEHEPQAEAPAPVEENPLDFSTIRNRHQDLPPPKPPQRLYGEVKEGASDPEQQDSVSVLANKPEKTSAVTPEPLVGEVAAGASLPGEVPPSVAGTSQAPQPKEE